jgi:hypothetical protein
VLLDEIVIIKRQGFVAVLRVISTTLIPVVKKQKGNPCTRNEEIGEFEMKKTFSMILVLVALITALVVTEVIASPIQSSVDGKSKKTPGAQATANALKHQDQQAKGKKTPETTDTLEIVKKNVMFTGTIAAITETQMDLTLKDESVVSILLGIDSSIKVPKGKSQKPTEELVVETLEPSETLEPGTETPEPSVYGLSVGMVVKVKANLMSDDTYVAVKIQVIPGKPVKAYHVGVVYAYTPGVSITIGTKKCEFTTYLLTSATKYLPTERMDQLKVGSLVTVISPRDVTGGPLTAAGIVIHPDKTLNGEETEEPTEVQTEEPSAEPTEEPGCVLPTLEPTVAPTEVP